MNATSPTGSILQFGLVANEQHDNAVRLADRNWHKHAAIFCATQPYWNKVAKHSLQKYGVPLNAVAHHGYVTMYAYIRQPSKKKPLQEIDAEPYMSPYHPRGDAVVELLAASIKSRDIIAGRPDGAAVGKKRKRLNVFEEICEHSLKTVKALQAHACAEAKKGNPGLGRILRKERIEARGCALRCVGRDERTGTAGSAGREFDAEARSSRPRAALRMRRSLRKWSGWPPST